MSKKSKKAKEAEKVDSVEQEVEETQVAEEETEETLSEGDAWEEKYNEVNDRYLRLYSEFDNYRRRTSKEKIDLISSASEGVVKDLLSVLDDFERAMEHNENSDDASSIKEGFQLIYNKFKNTLEGKGLAPMESKGEVFDTELHEAVTNFSVEDKSQKGKVIDVVEKGYFLNDKVLRYAKVVVGQ